MAEPVMPQVRKCEVCNRDYQVHEKWQYVLCEDCFREKAKQWGLAAFKEIYNIQTVTKEQAHLPIPPLYLIPLRKINEETRNIEPSNRTCGRCHTTYRVYNDWPYVVCKKCAVDKAIEWQNMVKSEIWGLEGDAVDMVPLPVPPMPLKRVDDVKSVMTEEDASRIQAHADKSGENEDFKRRAQAAAARNQFLQ